MKVYFIKNGKLELSSLSQTIEQEKMGWYTRGLIRLKRDDFVISKKTTQEEKEFGERIKTNFLEKRHETVRDEMCKLITITLEADRSGNHFAPQYLNVILHGNLFECLEDRFVDYIATWVVTVKTIWRDECGNYWGKKFTTGEMKPLEVNGLHSLTWSKEYPVPESLSRNACTRQNLVSVELVLHDQPSQSD